jgi:hypothetical protein
MTFLTTQSVQQFSIDPFAWNMPHLVCVEIATEFETTMAETTLTRTVLINRTAVPIAKMNVQGSSKHSLEDCLKMAHKFDQNFGFKRRNLEAQICMSTLWTPGTTPAQRDRNDLRLIPSAECGCSATLCTLEFASVMGHVAWSILFAMVNRPFAAMVR